MSLEDDWAKAKPVSGSLKSDWEKAKPEAPKELSLSDELGRQSKEALGGFFEPLLAMGSGMAGKVLGDIGGLGAVGKEMISPTPGGGDPAGFARDIQQRMTYQPRTQAGASPYNPLNAVPMGLGKLFEFLGRQAGRGTEALGGAMGVPPTVTGPAASGARETVEQALGLGTIKGLPKVAAGTEAGLQRGASRLMQSALKPPLEAARKGQAEPAVKTLLEQGINVSRGGIEKLNDKITDLNTRISEVIQNSPAVIDKQAVGYRLQGLIDKFQKQVNPEKDVRAIQKAWDEFLDHPLLRGNNIPIQTAQEMKKGTYRALGTKPYGELSGAETEAQKTLARGLKEEIAAMAPEVRPLNAEESKLLNALPLVERRVLHEANKNLTGLGFLSWNPKMFVAYMADRSSLFKSLVARMLSGTTKGVPNMNIAAPAFGIGAIEQATLPPQGMAPPQQ